MAEAEIILPITDTSSLPSNRIDILTSAESGAPIEEFAEISIQVSGGTGIVMEAQTSTDGGLTFRNIQAGNYDGYRQYDTGTQDTLAGTITDLNGLRFTQRNVRSAGRLYNFGLAAPAFARSADLTSFGNYLRSISHHSEICNALRLQWKSGAGTSSTVEVIGHRRTRSRVIAVIDFAATPGSVFDVFADLEGRTLDKYMKIYGVWQNILPKPNPDVVTMQLRPAGGEFVTSGYQNGRWSNTGETCITNEAWARVFSWSSSTQSNAVTEILGLAKTMPVTWRNDALDGARHQMNGMLRTVRAPIDAIRIACATPLTGGKLTLTGEFI